MPRIETTSQPNFPYEKHPFNRFGIARFIDHKAEAEHVSIGRVGWAPFAYKLALDHLRYKASGALARYMDLADSLDGLGALSDWNTREPADMAKWLQRFEKDAALFDRANLPRDELGAQQALRDMLFPLCPPHHGQVLSCTEEYYRWHQRLEHQAYHATLQQRYDWLQAQVAAQYQRAGYEVDGPLFKLDGFEALYFIDEDVFSF